MVSLQISIQEPKLGDHAAARIGQERKLDTSGPSKFAKRLLGVVTNSDQPYPAAINLPVDLLQLNELRFAIGSPAGASVEDNEGAPALSPVVQTNRIAVHIGKLEVRKQLPDGRPDSCVIHLSHLNTNYKLARSLPFDFEVGVLPEVKLTSLLTRRRGR
jgi:hypothetical protein